MSNLNTHSSWVSRTFHNLEILTLNLEVKLYRCTEGKKITTLINSKKIKKILRVQDSMKMHVTNRIWVTKQDVTDNL